MYTHFANLEPFNLLSETETTGLTKRIEEGFFTLTRYLRNISHIHNKKPEA